MTGTPYDKEAVDAFATSEVLPEKQIRSYERFMGKVSRFFMRRIAKKLGWKILGSRACRGAGIESVEDE